MYGRPPTQRSVKRSQFSMKYPLNLEQSPLNLGKNSIGSKSNATQQSLIKSSPSRTNNCRARRSELRSEQKNIIIIFNVLALEMNV